MTIIWLFIGGGPSARDPLAQRFKVQLVLFNQSAEMSIEKDRWSWPRFYFLRYR